MQLDPATSANVSPLPAFVPSALSVPRRPVRAVLKGAALSFAGASALSLVAQRLFPALPGPTFPMKGWVALFMLVVFAPVGETLIMAGVLSLLLRFLPPVAAILVSAAGWGIAHSIEAPAWGLVIWWPFLIFSTLFVTWRVRGFWVAVGLVACVHGLQNLLPALLVARGG